MEILNHMEHLGVTMGRLIAILFPGEELDVLEKKGIALETVRQRSAWIRTSDLAEEGVTTERMVLLHLLWFQSIGRVVIEDVDPLTGAVRIRLDFSDQHERKEVQERNS